MHAIFEMWTELGRYVRRFVATRVKDSATADDITQEVMLKIQSQLDSLPPEEKLNAWVIAIARNAIVDHYRAAALRNHTHIDEIAPIVSDIVQDDVLLELTPCLARMIEQLAEPYRDALRLSDIQGLSQQQVADRAGISLSGAKSRVQRARQMLREMIEDCCKIERDALGNAFDYQTTPKSKSYCGIKDDGPSQR